MFPWMAEAYDAGLRGDLGPLAVHASDLERDPSAPARACHEAIRGLRWFVKSAPGRPAPIDVSSLADLSRAPGAVVDIAARALAHEVRAAALAFDGKRVAAASARMLELAPGGGVEARCWAAVAEGWRAVMTGAPLSADLEAAGREAGRIGRAELLLEATSVRALIQNSSQSDAVAVSRRASRMARTEALPHSEYLANLALARNRRLDGKPHLATRILRALWGVAPAPWRPWLSWELLLATGKAGPQLSGPALTLSAYLDAARAGDGPALDRAAIELDAAVHGAAPLSVDWLAVRFATDVKRPLEGAPRELVSWARGEGAEVPFGLSGLSSELDGDLDPAYVVSPAGGGARRILGIGAPLLRALYEVTEPVGSEGKQLRTDSAVAALALARPVALGEDALFRTLYGFDYESARHQAVRDTLYARVRKRIAPAKLEREEGRISIAYERALLVPDPRCAPPAEMNILRVLAERAGAAAKEVADELKIPLRTAQDALKRLAEDGAVKKEKAHLGLTYVLEDTTFTEPTAGTRPEYLPPEHTPTR